MTLRWVIAGGAALALAMSTLPFARGRRCRRDRHGGHL